jgi:hypothetical protein
MSLVATRYHFGTLDVSSRKQQAFEIRASNALVFTSESFQLSLGFSDLGVEVLQLITRVFYTVGAIQYLSLNATFSYITHTAIAKLQLAGCQATMAIDIFSFEAMLKLLAPSFGNLSPGTIIIFLGRFIRWTFGTDETAISHHFFHVSSLLGTGNTPNSCF